MSTESLVSSTSSFTGDIDSYLDKIGSKAPQSWRKPRSRIYDYNRTLGNEYYQVNYDSRWRVSNTEVKSIFVSAFLNIPVCQQIVKKLQSIMFPRCLNIS